MRLLSIILFLYFSCPVFANTIVVDKGLVINTIRKALSAAKDNDIIIIKKGIYKEGNIIIQKSISLVGEEGAILDGEGKYEILTISGRKIFVKGICFRNSGYSSMNDYAAIGIIDAQFVNIENNRIENSFFGIHVANSRYCFITDNEIKGLPKTEQTSGNGIHLWKCENMLVKSNRVQGHRDGIYFEFVTKSVIAKNYSHNNIRYGLHFMFSNNDTYRENSFRQNGAGVAVMYSQHVYMNDNDFEYNWGPNAYGLLLKEISDAVISGNRFTQNTVGILMESTNRIEAFSNNFDNNGWALRIQASCDGNEIHRNNFQGNTFDVATNGTMMLNKFYQNYWDKYDGYDLDKNNIGDVPYHPVSMYSMIIEQNPNALILLRSFVVSLLDRAEKSIPSITPEHLIDEQPLMKAI